MSNIIWIITQELLKELAFLFIGMIMFVIIAMIFYGISCKKLWKQEGLRTVLALIAIGALSLVVFSLLISPSLEPPLSVRQPNRTIPMPGPTPTRYGPEKPMIGTVTWTPSPTHTPTSTYTPTPTDRFPFPTPSSTSTPTLRFSSPTATPTPTPTPPCFGEGGLFYFEQPTVNSEFVFGKSISIVIRFNPQAMAKMDYIHYSIRFSSENPKYLELERLNTIKPKTSFEEGAREGRVKDAVIYHHGWSPPSPGTFWITAIFYDQRGQYSAESMKQCGVQIKVVR